MRSARLVALLLLGMSVASWVVILWKAWLLPRAGTDVARSVAAFWQAASLDDARPRASAAFDRERAGAAADRRPRGRRRPAARWRRRVTARSNSPACCAMRCMPCMGQAAIRPGVAGHGRLDRALRGLLGTVWGIYHALTSIAGSGQISIDRVAGPVGEALIMTAAGLAVAIPAVLAYNWFGRIIGRIEAELEGFARDLRELLSHKTKRLRRSPLKGASSTTPTA
jgi:biopolymer transport protein ExbB